MKSSSLCSLAFAIVVLVAAVPGHAENGFIAALWNQYQLGRYCPDKAQKWTMAAQSDCAECGWGWEPPSKEVAALQPLAAEADEAAIYLEASHSQAKADACTAESLQYLNRDTRARRIWMGLITARWLGLKKAKLIRGYCQIGFWPYLKSADVRAYGIRNAYERQRRDGGPVFVSRAFTEQLKAACLDADSASALQNAEALFAYTIPFVNSPELFDAVEHHRSAIQNMHTGKSITDSELLRTDLRHIEHVRLQSDPQLSQQIESFLSNESNHRAKMSQALRLGEIDEDQRDYLFEMGALQSTLSDRGLIGVNDGGGQKISSTAACIIARHEPTLVGSALQFLAESAVPSGLAFKALGWLGRAKKLSRLQHVGRSIGYGTGAVGIKDLGRQVRHSCISGSRKASRLTELSQGSLLMQLEGGNLPEDLNYNQAVFELPQDVAPSCANGESPSLLVNKAMEVSCATDIVWSLLPLEVTLPVAVLGAVMAK